MMKSNFKSYGYQQKSSDQSQLVQIKGYPNGHFLEMSPKIDLTMRDHGDTPQLKKETVEQII